MMFLSAVWLSIRLKKGTLITDSHLNHAGRFVGWYKGRSFYAPTVPIYGQNMGPEGKCYF